LQPHGRRSNGRRRTRNPASPDLYFRACCVCVRNPRTSLPAVKSGTPWSASELAELAKLVVDGVPTRDITAYLRPGLMRSSARSPQLAAEMLHGAVRLIGFIEPCQPTTGLKLPSPGLASREKNTGARWEITVAFDRGCWQRCRRPFKALFPFARCWPSYRSTHKRIGRNRNPYRRRILSPAGARSRRYASLHLILQNLLLHQR
jgi:hypothetical protein